MWALLQVLCTTVLCSETLSATVPHPPDQAALNETNVKINEYLDPSCSALGGICVPELDCPKGFVNKKGLCSQRLDYECCNTIPLTRTTCKENGGECFDNCRESLRIKRGASSCLANEYCCLLLV